MGYLGCNEYVPKELREEAEKLVKNNKAPSKADAYRDILTNHKLGSATKDIYKGFTLGLDDMFGRPKRRRKRK